MIRISSSSLLVLFIVLAFNCKTTNNVMLTYIDQNNNQYIVSENKLSYVPITKEESSSGVYSGGDPVSVIITSERSNQLMEMAESLFNNSERKNTKREMLTSVLTIKTSDSTKKVILKKSKARMAFEKLLLSLKH